MAHADALLTMQDQEGALRYPFAYRYYATKQMLEPGWVSGMAQGQAISVWVRAYKLTDDERYAAAAARALKFMKKPVEEGGTWASLKAISPRLAALGIPDEYPNQPSTYTLNGALFAMLGLYDLSVTAPEATTRQDAQRMLDNSLEAMNHLLPLYDIGGFTSYDLAHITLKLEGPHVAPRYHAAHIYLLHALYEATGKGSLKLYETRWSSYVK
ncbi:D-glucuronyl C5-epimerase family protein [Deinococcus radiophilus]|uniref:D-glucuronyl C5-epimerase family protein n=1 Tax=Deinococcus radiophilus TaxID=32062 RepID=UPI001E5285F6|nr:D-glucuronyl C5-epimerase family protein [Deinococcus radiophilus]UFA51761.1 D-glucuronyl C5-epimerase family protein [Deinococcus radiophilus]